MNTTQIQRTRCASFAIAALCMAIAQAQNAAVTVNVDANANKHPISPYIYGVAPPGNGSSAATLNDLNTPLNRLGGNNASRYNWQLNAANHDFDWYFESIPENSATAGELGDTFISVSHTGNAQPMITIPMLDWVAKVGTGRSKLASFSQAKYGAQQDADWQWYSDAGNGVLASNGQNITNDPNDANVAAGVAFQQNWVQHIVTKWGLAASSGLKFYILDNEHSIWQGTHRDVHPIGATEGEIRQKMIDYSNMIKAADPGAIVVGPEEWGWSGYFYSGYDQQYGAAHGWCCYPDRAANGNMDYMPWLLDQLHQYDVANGKHVLDVFSLHIYPQSGEFGDDTSTAMQQLRNRSTRSLWDPNYTDESWIGARVYLIPRMKAWVATYYPGLKTAITEYNWGAEGHINGATTQADIYGIFGREGLDYAARWTTPDPSTPTYKAMKMYRNYDGSKSGFGDTSVSATVPNPDNLSAFAATRSTDGALTVMVVSKVLTGTTPVTVHVANFTPGASAHVWQLTSSNTIAHPADVAVAAGNITLSVPAQSITLFVVPGSGGANNPPTAVATAMPSGGIAQFRTYLRSTGSSDSDGSIVAYAWNFGDGTTSNAANPPAHTYTAVGTYNATLTVTDDKGATGSKTAIITVTNGSGPIPAPINLQAHVATGGKVNLTWQDNSNNEEGFAIERATSPSTTYAEVGRVAANTTQFVQAGVAAGTYRYRLHAYNATTGRVSANSNVVTATVH